MEKIGLVTEIAADLPQEIIDKYKIAIVPVKLNWPDLENLPGENTFQKMREAEKRGIKSFGKTSQPAVKDFSDKFGQQLASFGKVICITITSKLSGSNNSATQAVKLLKSEDQQRIFIVDSLSVAGGQALLVLKAAELIGEGREVPEIIKELEFLKTKVRTIVTFGNTKWVEASGRISHLVAIIMNKMILAGIRPLLSFKNGVLSPAGLKINAKDIPTMLFRQFESEVKKIEGDKKIQVIINHGDNLPSAQRLKEMIEPEFKTAKVSFITMIDDVVGVLAGPDTIVLAWCEF